MENASLMTERLRLSGAPATIVACEDLDEPSGLGTVLFYHGFSVSRRTNIHELRHLARAGFVAVGIDAVGHGERRYPDFQERFAGEQTDEPYYRIVEESAVEVPGIFDHLAAIGRCDGERLGIAGISMGGFITYAAALLDRRIRAAVAMMASPEWAGGREKSPHLHPEKFFPLALLSQTAALDTVVPPSATEEFHQRLAPYYQTTPERLRHIEFPDAGHILPAPAWEQAVLTMVEWFEQFLQG